MDNPRTIFLKLFKRVHWGDIMKKISRNTKVFVFMNENKFYTMFGQTQKTQGLIVIHFPPKIKPGLLCTL